MRQLIGVPSISGFATAVENSDGSNLVFSFDRARSASPCLDVVNLAVRHMTLPIPTSQRARRTD
jgi:hypothetical protein